MLGLGAGVVRETADVVLPAALRKGQLYQNMVSATLRFVVEQVGEVKGAYVGEQPLPADFVARRAAGNAVEMLGLVAFRASPVWVLAALADVSGMGRMLIPEIADELRSHGLLEPNTRFETVDQILDGLERTSSRLAATVNTPPLDVATLRQELWSLREDARGLQPSSLPTGEAVHTLWVRLRDESARQGTSIFATSSMLAVSALHAVPDRMRWLSLSAKAVAGRTGRVVGASILDYYTGALQQVGEVGYAAFARRQLGPYVRAAASQFSSDHTTLTERLLDSLSRRAGEPEVRVDPATRTKV